MSIKYFIKQKLFAEMLTNLEYGLFVLDGQMEYIHVNDIFAKIIGLPSDDIIGKPLSIYDQKTLQIETKIVLDEILNNLLLKRFHEGVVNVGVDRNNLNDINVKIYGMQAAGDIFYVGILYEESIKNLPRNDKELELKNFDSITQLPLKQYFMIQLSDLLLEAENVVVARLTVNHFRMLKTNYSEESMNHLMIEFVQRVYELNLKELISFSRFNDEDFALVFNVNNTVDIRSKFERILQLTEKPYIIGDVTVYLQFSIGVSTYPEDGSQADILLENADKALHYAKEKSDDILWYDEQQVKVSAKKIQLENELRNALKDNEFVPVYQPKVDLETMEIVGFEALVRWDHPRLGRISPADFLEALIEYKLTFELFCFMAEKVVKHLYIWQLRGMKQTLCLNADSYDFLHPDFISFMTKLLARYPVVFGSLHVEVTETSLMQQYDVDILSQFKKLKDLGVSIALDDFGTGYASISYLRDYPFDYIKIDKSFIEDLDKDNTQLLIVRAIIDLASALDLYTVAEGIETALHYDIMSDMGCIHGQGYLFGKPMSYTEATKMVASSVEGPLTVCPNAQDIFEEVKQLNKDDAKKAVTLTAKERRKNIAINREKQSTRIKSRNISPKNQEAISESDINIDQIIDHDEKFDNVLTQIPISTENVREVK